MSGLPKIILGVPGKWADRREVVAAIAGQNNGYLFAGGILLQVAAKRHCEVEIYDPDPQLCRAFEIAGQGAFTEEELAAIDDHTSTLYLIGNGGSLEHARWMMDAAQEVLRAGGMAVKVESSGQAFTANDWHELCNLSDAPEFAVYRAMVTFAGGEEDFYSCGMHNLGHRDAEIQSDLPLEEVANLVHQFLCYLCFANAEIADDETFSLAADAPRYRAHTMPCTRFAQDDPFYNPYGIWRLVGE